MVSASIGDRLQREAVLDGIEHLLETVANPALVQAFAAVDAMPEERRAEVRRELASVESFRALGVSVPEELRVCLRSFEDPSEPDPAFDADAGIVAAPIETETWCISVGVIVCVTWGKSFPITSRSPDAAAGDVDERVDGTATVPGGSSVAEMRGSLRAITAYTQSAAFRGLLDELYGLPHGERKAFVRDVLLDRTELHRRGARPPADLVVQRSSFADRRPTLFCVTKKLSRGGAKVTITFDSATRG